MIVLVTGGFGYLGGVVSNFLIQNKNSVRIGTSRKNANIPSQLVNCKIVFIDLLNIDSLEMACKGVDLILHMAAMNAQDCQKDPKKALLINGLGTLNLLKAAKRQGVYKIIYFSTAHVYGSALKGNVDELSLPRPLHPYSITHRLAEDYILEYMNQDIIKGAILRLSNVVTPPLNMNTNCWMLFVNDICMQAVKNRKICIYSKIDVTRDFVSIEYIFQVLVFLLNNENNENIYNIGSGAALPISKISEMVVNRCEILFGYRPPIVTQDGFKIEKNNFLYGVDKINKIVPFLNNFPIEAQVDKLLMLLEANG
jgi:UDP-glucose 4-epimerase